MFEIWIFMVESIYDAADKEIEKHFHVEKLKGNCGTLERFVDVGSEIDD
jgi:hypothetical protein